ncbi:MAG: COX15/CtaA family protein, partial [Rhodoferax sp.]|nr:COX15/CtaA family protein [Rhodoferax sp.]
PAIVTLHLLGGYVLLALLTIQWVRVAIRDGGLSVQTVPVSLRLWASIGLAMLFLQSASGAWVSTNYAVLACSEFPMCQGSWWPMMDFTQGFSIWRPLGLGKDGAPVSFQALTAIHVVHRILAMATLLLLARVVFALYSMDSLRKLAWLLGGVLVLQLATGLSNVVLDWPLFTAVLHTGGAGALVVILVRMLASTTARPLGVASGPIRMGLQA